MAASGSAVVQVNVEVEAKAEVAVYSKVAVEMPSTRAMVEAARWQ